MHHCNEAQFSPWLLLLLTLQIRIVLQSLVKAGKCRAPGDAGATLGYQTPTQSRAGVTWVLLPVDVASRYLYSSLLSVMNVGVTTCIQGKIVFCAFWYLVPRYTSSVFQPRKKNRLVVVFFVVVLFLFFLNFNSLLSKYRQLNNCFTS